MPNDAKLGLLAGVAGVIAAAVLFAQQPTAPPAGPAAPVAVAPPATAALPVAVRPDPPPAAVVTGSRKEVVARPTSRPAAGDDD